MTKGLKDERRFKTKTEREEIRREGGFLLKIRQERGGGFFEVEGGRRVE